MLRLREFNLILDSREGQIRQPLTMTTCSHHGRPLNRDEYSDHKYLLENGFGGTPGYREAQNLRDTSRRTRVEDSCLHYNRDDITPHHILPPTSQQLLLQRLRQSPLLHDILACHTGISPLKIEPIRGVAAHGYDWMRFSLMSIGGVRRELSKRNSTQVEPTSCTTVLFVEGAHPEAFACTTNQTASGRLLARP